MSEVKGYSIVKFMHELYDNMAQYFGEIFDGIELAIDDHEEGLTLESHQLIFRVIVNTRVQHEDHYAMGITIYPFIFTEEDFIDPNLFSFMINYIEEQQAKLKEKTDNDATQRSH